MKATDPLRVRSGVSVLFLLVMSLMVCVADGDKVEMRNGDRYFGKILSLSSNTVVLESRVLGTIQLPREEVASLALGSLTNRVGQPPAASRARTIGSGTNQLEVLVRQLAAETNAIRRVQQDYLAGASPEATQKFNQMLGDISTGKLTLQGLRGEAAAAAKQLKELKGGLGEETGDLLDSYLKILENFLAETEGPGDSASGVKSKTPLK